VFYELKIDEVDLCDMVRGLPMANDTSRKELKKSKSPKSNESNKRKAKVIRFAESATEKTLTELNIAQDDVVFAMDIGTRTVVGVVGVQERDFFRVIATEICEHKSRAMIDGQIHDIDQVVSAAAEVKQKLEKRIGFELKSVAIAAAGRVLKTCQVRVDRKLEQTTEIDDDLVNSLEIEGIQQAQMILDEAAEGEEKAQFYCVGYSVINYYLNGYVISKLTGHKGKDIGADVLATFLPLVVVDSLYSVMNKIGLEVRSLTLEPIAAINATIPQDLRMLNLALVDIGAGTSDIALTKGGSVIAYAMVPIAGDEITEKICQQYLVDFKNGEKIKIALSSGKEQISFTDIVKKKQVVTNGEVMSVIDDTLQLLAASISQQILEYNGKAPNAVFLVGGGSRIPRLPELIAKNLGLPSERVVVRGRDVIRDVKFCDNRLYGPESITPLGIAITAQMKYGKDFISVTVNEKKVKLFNSKKLTVADALILFGFDAQNLIGRSGRKISFTINGEGKNVRGEYGKPAEIYVNGEISSLDTSIENGDNIIVIPAQNGKDATVRASELVSGYNTGVVKLNGNPVDISPQIFINGKQVSDNELLNDGDDVQISQIRTLRELLEAGGFAAECCVIYVNNTKVSDLDYVLNDGDDVICDEMDAYREVTDSSAEDASNVSPDHVEKQTESKIEDRIAVMEDGIAALEELSPHQELSPSSPSPLFPSFEVFVNGSKIVMDGSKSQYIFVDIFNYINFDLSKPKGTIVLMLNGRPAAYTDIIRPGDKIDIYWK